MGWQRLAAIGLIVSVACTGAAQGAEPPEPSPRLMPDLGLSLDGVPGEVSLRLPLASEGHLLYGLLGPYLSLGSAATLGVPWSTSITPGLRRDPEGPDDLRVGAGVAVPVSERVRLFGEYRFLRGRLDAGVGRPHREPDGTDFRAGFSIRLD